ncbi:MAG: hypothetical protein ABSF28_08945 [Terracidiphilus sp.]|jgi:hypothetical protein
MQVLFKSTDQNANTHCCVCGQGFELTWERRPVSEVMNVLFEIQKKLCNHHREEAGPQAHPESGVLIPELTQAMPVRSASVQNMQQDAS